VTTGAKEHRCENRRDEPSEKGVSRARSHLRSVRQQGERRLSTEPAPAWPGHVDRHRECELPYVRARGPLWLARPIVIIDMYEHAYYVDYKNKKGDYVSAYPKFIDWAEVDRRIKSIR